MKASTAAKFRFAKRVALIVPLALATHVYAQGTAGGIGAPAGAAGMTGNPAGSAGIPPAAGAMPGNPTIQPGGPGPTVPPPGNSGIAGGAINPAPGTSTISPPSNGLPTTPGMAGGTRGGTGAGCNCPSPATTGLPPGTPTDPRTGVTGGCAC